VFYRASFNADKKGSTADTPKKTITLAYFLGDR
jgi:hypothetical protein